MKTKTLKKKIFIKLGDIVGSRNLKLSFSLRYFGHRGHFPNLKNPSDISEFMLSSMLKPDFSRYAKYADKVKVRNYVKAKGHENILLKHYAVWSNPQSINIKDLPDKFILKANNACGNHIICRDKTQFDIKKAIHILSKNLLLPKTEKFLKEPHYKYISPLIFAEELVETKDNNPPFDIKFHCINGEPYDIFICTERGWNKKYKTYDLNWNSKNTTKTEYLSGFQLDRPTQLEEMINISRDLASDFPFVRVDFYLHPKKIIFSELTFTPWGGYMNSYTNEEILKMGEILRKGTKL
ncbi:MAG: ATP-grasp fold amidoligase family protein [Bacteroidales bacterium]|nr:ATP-grasp fold amidoligase family protein [Bacteroidales bacterium]MDD3962309.1 ATP-grasp fold amidoligase family protein [Bacteroidales bacterium]MDY0286581.1 ATP-grasp fold amidoligase family protein [Bacteroidales bacterium]